MPQWTRLEPRTNSANVEQTLQARVHDPLWLLGRQWQFGEFQGEDAASLARVYVELEYSPITHYQTSSQASPTPYYSEIPLEKLVEAETFEAGSEQYAVEAGAYFYDLLSAAVGVDQAKIYLDNLSNSEFVYKHTAGIENNLNQAFTPAAHHLFASRIFDGRELFKLIAKQTDESQILKDLGIRQQDHASVKRVIELWKKWYYREKTETPPSAWVSERQEYAFSLFCDTPDNRSIQLSVSEHTSGSLSWDAFDGIQLKSRIDSAISSQSGVRNYNLVPSELEFPGMPASRFWQFEDAKVNFGAVTPSENDLALSLIIDFMLRQGNNYFLIPLSVPIGSLVHIKKVTGTDTFGRGGVTGVDTFGKEEITFKSANNSGPNQWRMYCLSNETEVLSEYFFLPPVLPKTLESKPIEEVAFARDEAANLAWAIEKIVTNTVGETVELHLSPSTLSQPGSPLAVNEKDSASALVYRFRNEVPPHWFPLMQNGHTFELVHKEGALGQILTNPPVTQIKSEEIPRESVRVLRRYQLARWINGTTHLWRSRSKEIGQQPESLGGLHFDFVESQPSVTG